MEGGLSPRPEIEVEAERGEEHRADAAVERAAVREAQRDRLKRSALERSPARGVAAVKMLRAADCSEVYLVIGTFWSWSCFSRCGGVSAGLSRPQGIGPALEMCHRNAYVINIENQQNCTNDTLVI